MWDGIGMGMGGWVLLRRMNGCDALPAVEER